MTELIFWLFIGVIFYTYIGYPLLTLFLSLFNNHPVHKKDIEPSVTFLITAYNEEKNISQKLDNTLSLDYPRDKLEIMVASDGSTDNTDEIVKSFSGRGVVLHRVEGRVGKTETQNQAVKTAIGEIIIFSDATTNYDRNAIRKIVRNYNDPTIGAVSGRYEYLNPTGASVGTGTVLFWKYENFIKSRQTRIKTITGCCGCIYSVRRRLYEPLPKEIISDLVEPLKIIEKGYRIAFEPEAIAYEVTEEKALEEFSMRVRVITRGMNGLAYVKDLLNPFRNKFVAFQLHSHKVLRWLIPFFLVLIFIANCMLLDQKLYQFLFIGQTVFYGAAFGGWYLEKIGKKHKILSLPLYFCVVNLASFRAFFNFILGRKMVTWETIRK
ncbi:glycosyltransferase family 2 protein [Desulfobacula toluolica]|uniref:Glycosyl transferase, family II n=1 Tax=Desulfobacula toluolica (strain DSM 7467 / Tol2) TaxID=651182 RepID=K0NKL9_DESTT|nr:glycosyltransferase family 2 protein [Desulfobacula toluolica]CCK80488.1 glycosyl transferase, family II [Desulfobacula toluolica Tol2]